MAGNSICIAIGSTCSLPGELAGNLAQIDTFSAQAAMNWCDLLLTPEMSATGYGSYPDVLALAEPAGAGPVYEGLARLASRDRLVVCAGFPERAGEKIHLSHYAVYPDGTFVVQRKHRVTPTEAPLAPSVELFYDGTEEIGHVHPGDERFTTFTVAGATCAIVICADLGVRGLGELLRQAGVQVMLLPTGAGGKREERLSVGELLTPEGQERLRTILAAPVVDPKGALECIRLRRATAAVNMGGWDGRKYWHGGSGSIVGPAGEILAIAPGVPVIERARPVFAWAEVDLSPCVPEEATA